MHFIPDLYNPLPALIVQHPFLAIPPAMNGHVTTDTDTGNGITRYNVIKKVFDLSKMGCLANKTASLSNILSDYIHGLVFANHGQR